jgi:hypothetical protein
VQRRLKQISKHLILHRAKAIAHAVRRERLGCLRGPPGTQPCRLYSGTSPWTPPSAAPGFPAAGHRPPSRGARPSWSSRRLHEIAHALAFLETGHKGHGPPWKAVCVRIGAEPIRCYKGGVTMPVAKWRARCPGCRVEHHLHRRPKRLGGWYCKKCGREKGCLSWEPAEGRM